MPELPEVETIRRDLEPALAGARVERFWTSGKALRLCRPVAVNPLAKACVGRRFLGVRRRGKYLLLDVEASSVIVVHLGMSGRLLLEPSTAPAVAHTHVVWSLNAGRNLKFVDPRRFGQVTLCRAGEEDSLPELAVLGIDPLGGQLTLPRLQMLAARTRRDVKGFLLDQSRVAGLGNIYACEALFEARIHPGARTNRLRGRRIALLRDAVVAVLERAIVNRGTSFRDYVDASGEAGGNQHALRAYGREGEPCPRGDGGRICRVTMGGRSTYFCPTCQVR